MSLKINDVSGQVVDSAMKVHSKLGPGLLVSGAVIVELKAIATLLPVHEAQLLSYLRLGGRSVGLLINFHVVHLKDGIKRLVNNFSDSSAPPLRPPRPLR